MSEQKTRELKGTRVGVVTSDQRHQTCTVEVHFLGKHPKYGKYVRQRSRFHVHDPENQAARGDRVRIVNCRPVSKTKSWRLVEVIEKAPGAEHASAEPQDIVEAQ